MPAKRPAAPRRNRRSEIMSVTELLLHQRGLSSVTTRAIAEAVPCSEGAIYVHFRSRLDLLLDVLEQSLPEMLVPLHALAGMAGQKTPHTNLATAMQGLGKFHERMAPVLGSLFAEPDLLQAFRETLAARGKGPLGAITRIAQYIKAEQKLGRINPGIDAEAAAATLMSVSFFQAFTAALFGSPAPKLSPKRMIASLL